MHLKILTFNWHEPYLCLLAKLGHHFSIIAPETSTGIFRKWDIHMRDLPENCRLVTHEEALASLEASEFDLIIAHNVKDLIWAQNFDLPKICVFHCKLSTEIELSANPVDREDYHQRVTELLRDAKAVFISDSKREDWNIPGDVIKHGLDLADYGGYSGRTGQVLRVGNLLKEMGKARGFEASETLIKGFPHLTLGLNPALPNARLSESFTDLQEQYRNSRVYLNTIRAPYEDGYNLSLLEAMATGMPVVSVDHPASPIKEGVNGFISDDLSYLREKIKELLEDEEQARMLGGQARETIRHEFPIGRFLEGWHHLIQATLLDYLEDKGISKNRKSIPFQNRTRKNVLMDFVSHPATTAHYLARAFRQEHNVVTCGSHIDDHIIRQWNLESLNWPVDPQDIFRGQQTGIEEIIAQLPEDWEPDFYLYIETGLNKIPHDFGSNQYPQGLLFD